MLKIFIWTFLIGIFGPSCKQAGKENTIGRVSLTPLDIAKTNQTFIVDYKSETYKISLGKSYKNTEREIDWSWAALNDEDGQLDPSGKNSFLYLGEQLITYDEAEWLPSLHIETVNNVIISFTCSVSFILGDNPLGKETFLKILSKNIKNLHKKEIVQSLTTKGYFFKENSGYVETFKLIEGKEGEYDHFIYSVKVKNENGG